MLKPHLVLTTSIALAGLVAGPVPARLNAAPNQPPAAASSADLPSDQDLDALLLAKKWNDLGSALSRAKSPESVARKLDWLQSRLEVGGGSLLGFIYAKDLWDIGEAQKVNDPNQDLRLTAGLITLYTYELIAIDGAKCADHSAPGHRVDQLLMNNAPGLAYLKAQPQALKDKIVDLAIAMEKRTAPLRKLDDLLCRSGLEEMQAGLAAGKTREVPTPPGQVGKTVEVEPPADFAPRLLTPQSYLPDQERARANMKATLLKLIQ
jgi:hypothetical protein